MPNIGAPELIIILVIALLILGPGKLPEVGQALGRNPFPIIVPWIIRVKSGWEMKR